MESKLSFLSRLNWTLSEQFGFSPRQFVKGLTQIPWYLKSLAAFKKNSISSIEIMPCLHDRHDQSGSTNSEYFWQDLFIAQEIFKSSPEAHLDVGSRLDGFVAHVASFREIEVVDIRPSPNEIPNVKFTRMDLMADSPEVDGFYDSISCLHALEHFGLGRYGDTIDANGWKRGLGNIAKILREGGSLYLSVPVGRPRVVFNAHRVFDIEELINEMAKYQLKLSHLYYIEPGKAGVKGGEIDTVRTLMANEDYILSLIVVTKSLG
jgi:hypothetical protein